MAQVPLNHVGSPPFFPICRDARCIYVPELIDSGPCFMPV